MMLHTGNKYIGQFCNTNFVGWILENCSILTVISCILGQKRLDIGIFLGKLLYIDKKEYQYDQYATCCCLPIYDKSSYSGVHWGLDLGRTVAP